MLWREVLCLQFHILSIWYKPVGLRNEVHVLHKKKEFTEF